MPVLVTRWPARKCMTQRREVGPLPAASIKHASCIRRRCCPTARCSWWEDLTLPTVRKKAPPNCTIRRPGPGGPREALKTNAPSTPRHCCLTAWFSWQEDQGSFFQPNSQALSSTTRRDRLGRLRVVSTSVATSTLPPCCQTET